MITEKEITAAGKFSKTHGLKGELHALLDIDSDFFEEEPCFIVEVDGIFVPFFAEAVRPKGHFATLIKPEGVDSEEQAREFVGKTIYVRRSDLRAFETEMEEEADGAYADDFVGFTLLAPDGTVLGEIRDLETSTANALFIVKTPADNTLYVPVAEEFITALDPEAKTITMDLPEGLTDLNP